MEGGARQYADWQGGPGENGGWPALRAVQGGTPDPDDTREPRILLAEDEPVVAMSLAAILADEGYEVVGPAGSVDHALGIIGRDPHLDGALIDVNLRGRSAAPVAEALWRRGVNFAFVSGYGREAIPERFRHVPLVEKPCRAADLLAAVREARRPAQERAASDRWLHGPAGGANAAL